MARRFRLPKDIEELAAWYVRYVSPISLAGGFLADNIALARRVDALLTNALLFLYLVIAAAAIFLINLIETGRLRRSFALKALPLLPVVVQFCFGGLFSAYLSLYSRSADISVSWVFVIIIIMLVLGNERCARFYSRFSVQAAVYFTVLFSFLIFFLPVVFRQVGTVMFLFSGAAALSVMAAFLALLFALVPELRARKVGVARTIAALYLSFNILYFTGAIPPLPLSLKEAGVYHLVAREADGSYRLLGEPVPWYEPYLRYERVFDRAPGETVYVWNSIFAPSGLATTILHQWQRYDPGRAAWDTTDTVSFPIVGGRDGGYRGYSQKTALAEGRWRVNVLTGSGQLIGRVNFVVRDVEKAVPLVDTLR